MTQINLPRSLQNLVDAAQQPPRLPSPEALEMLKHLPTRPTERPLLSRWSGLNNSREVLDELVELGLAYRLKKGVYGSLVRDSSVGTVQWRAQEDVLTLTQVTPDGTRTLLRQARCLSVNTSVLRSAATHLNNAQLSAAVLHVSGRMHWGLIGTEATAAFWALE